MERGWEVSWHRESTPSHLTTPEGAWGDTEKPRNLLSSLLTTLLHRAESLPDSTPGFYILLNLEMLQPCLENCMVTLEMWDKPEKFQDASGRLF